MTDQSVTLDRESLVMPLPLSQVFEEDPSLEVSWRREYGDGVVDQLLSKSDTKGGPGSGHWGHAGNPGHRGGSLPGRMHGRGRVNEAYFRTGPGKRLVDDIDDPAFKEEVISILTNEHIQPWHIANLVGIDDDVPKGTFDAWTEPNEDGWATVGSNRYTTGIYRPTEKRIFIRSGYGLVEELEHGNQCKCTLTHELGHHVVRANIGDIYPGSIRADRHRMFVSSTITNGLLKARNIILEETHSSERSHADQQKRLGDLFSSMGLRPYSFEDRDELAAESFMVYVHGTSAQRDNLAQFLGVSSLDTMFRWETGQE